MLNDSKLRMMVYLYTRMVSAFVRMHITHRFTCHWMTSWILSQSENTQKSENCRSNVILKWCLLKNLNLKDMCVSSCEQLRHVGTRSPTTHPCLRNEMNIISWNMSSVEGANPFATTDTEIVMNCEVILWQSFTIVFGLTGILGMTLHNLPIYLELLNLGAI